MAQDNNIPLGVFQGPSPADNFLSSYAAGQQQQRQRVTQQREDTVFNQQQNEHAIDQLGAALDQVRDGDAQGFEQAKAFAVQNKLIDPTEAQKYSVNDLPRIRALSQQARQMAKQRTDADLAQRKFATDERVANANINQSNAAADASRASADRSRNGGKAPSGYTWNVDGSALIPVPGGPADQMNKPLTKEQSDAAGFASRLQMADERLGGKGISDEMMSGYNNTVNDIPLGIGNTLVTNDFQVGDQARRDFLNAQLRRESGALIGNPEFASGNQQYFPNYGDKPEVLDNKAISRKLAIVNMWTAAGPQYKQQAADARASLQKTRAEIAARNKQGAAKGSTATPEGWTIKRVK